jgi:CubicO group peptidase (beta-lactamase class C family)
MEDSSNYAGWHVSRAEKAGFDSSRLDAAVQFAINNESRMKRDIGAALVDGHFEEPWPIGKTIGPVKNRAGPSGIILRNGRLIKKWGNVERVDMTFSISKSYLALCAGIAVADGLIPDINAPVRDLVNDGGFSSEQNRDITWVQLLQLTSEWEGTLWDKPDWIDHNRVVNGSSSNGTKKGVQRQMQKPGTHWEYNDVRVNRLSLALMHVFRRPLPEVLKERIMDPIGASDTWKWHGYDNSWLEIDGRNMQSVSGGAHWGGGLWISALDHARVGQLMLNKGVWNGKRILPAKWVEACITPCPIAPGYGYLWWLNPTDNKIFPAASNSVFFALGVGSQVLYVDPENDLVIVVRWIEKDSIASFVERVLSSVSNS